MAALQPGYRRAGGRAVAGEHQRPGGAGHRVGYCLMQQAHPGGDGASGQGRADGFGCADGDREGRDVLVEVPGRDDEIPTAAAAVVSHDVPLFPSSGRGHCLRVPVAPLRFGAMAGG
jgi:hypothetical protein